MATKHLNQIDLAARWNISHRTLERWRWTGEGPRFVKLGGRVVYRLEDIEEYEREQIRASTADTATGIDQCAESGTGGPRRFSRSGIVGQLQRRIHEHRVVDVGIGRGGAGQCHGPDVAGLHTAQAVTPGLHSHGDDVFIPTAHGALALAQTFQCRKRPAVRRGDGGALQAADILGLPGEAPERAPAGGQRFGVAESDGTRDGDWGHRAHEREGCHDGNLPCACEVDQALRHGDVEVTRRVGVDDCVAVDRSVELIVGKATKIAQNFKGLFDLRRATREYKGKFVRQCELRVHRHIVAEVCRCVLRFDQWRDHLQDVEMLGQPCEITKVAGCSGATAAGAIGGMGRARAGVVAAAQAPTSDGQKSSRSAAAWAASGRSPTPRLCWRPGPTA